MFTRIVSLFLTKDPDKSLKSPGEGGRARHLSSTELHIVAAYPEETPGLRS